MGRWFRLAWVLSLAGLFSACGVFPSAEVVHQASFALIIDSGNRSAGPVISKEPAMALIAIPTGVFFGSFPLHLEQNGERSISALSDGRHLSLLRGLDQSLVNPDLLPFLFPSCDVPALPLGVTR